MGTAIKSGSASKAHGGDTPLAPTLDPVLGSDGSAASQAAFISLMQITTDAIITVDETQHVIFANVGASRIFGYPADELVGMPLDMLIPQRHRAAHRRHVAGIEPGVSASRVMSDRREVFGLHRSGTEFPAEASISSAAVDGSMVHTVILRDASDKRAARELLRKQADALRQSNEDLTQFAYVASHDLQEPLRQVTAYLRLLSDRYAGQLDEAADEFIGFAVDGAKRMKALIEDLLGYSRISNRELEMEPIDVQEIAEHIADLYAAKIEEAGAELTFADLPPVAGDAPQIERLFANLIDNALKYRSAAPPRISISAKPADDFWEFTVADNGIGIDPQLRGKVFEIFARLHGRERYPGTGIGLASCRRVVERHGGKIWVGSAEGGGSEFHFTLPQLRSH